MRRLTVLIAGLAALGGLVWLYGFGGVDYLAARASEGQRTVQNAMAAALRQLQAKDPGALTSLWALCFAYGFLHAAGPGHGKFLIGGYGLGRRVAARRLMGLAVASSLAQAAMAVLLVTVGLTLLGWGRAEMQDVADRSFAMLSDVLIAGIGLWLLWRGARALLRVRNPVDNLGEAGCDHGNKVTMRQPVALAGVPVGKAGDVGALAQWDRADFRSAVHPVSAFVTSDVMASDRVAFGAVASGNMTSGGVASGNVGTAVAGHVHVSGHTQPSRQTHKDTCESCGHAHGPTLEQAEAVRNWRDAVVLVGAIAARPCTGALFLLLLTWRIGLQWAGIIGAFVMGLGTASVTLIVALAAVSLRESALLQAASGPQTARIMAYLEMLAGALVIAVAVQLFAGHF